MSIFLYRLFIFFYTSGIKFAAIWNHKASLWVKGRRNPLPEVSTQSIWMHCASLGEFEQGRPLLEKLKAKYPQYKVVLSFFSPSGYEIRKHYQGADYVIYLPPDGRKNAKMLIGKLKPAVVLWVKYEYWFFYLDELKSRKVPVLLVSGIFRKSQPFFKWYGSLWRRMLGSFKMVFVQDQDSIDLLKTHGLSFNALVSGDTRFDRVIELAENFNEIDVIARFCSGHRVIVAGSTWEEDEAELVHYIKQHPAIRFIIAPHEIDNKNISDVKMLLKDTNPVLFSQTDQSDKLSNVLIIDNIGMLSRLYHYADITYIGGGFRESGIHNILEAAVYYKPVIFGPVYSKFKEARELVDTGGAFSINNAIELEALMNDLLGNDEKLRQSGYVAGNYVRANRGATNIILNYIYENRLLTN